MIDLEARRAAREGLRNVEEHRQRSAAAFELREVPNGTGGTSLNFTGYASVTETPYEMEDWAGPYTEVVRSGSFTKTLQEGADVAFVLNHGADTLARTKSGTLTLTEHTTGDVTGLYTEASLDPASPPVAYLRSAIERGDLDEMSFKFRVMRQQWSPDFDQRDIQEVSLHKGDVSIVNYGANPATAGLMALRNRVAIAGLTPRALAVAFAELRAGKAISAENMTILQSVLDLVADADEAVDEAQVVLSDLMGVPNPDDDTDVEADAEKIKEGGEPQVNAAPISLYQARARIERLRRK